VYIAHRVTNEYILTRHAFADRLVLTSREALLVTHDRRPAYTNVLTGRVLATIA